MNRNPFLKVEQKVNRAVYNNRATLHIVVRRRQYDAYTGEMDNADYEFLRTVYLSDPKTLSDYILSTREYRTGDLLVDIAYKEFLDAVSSVSDDDPDVGGATLAELRDTESNKYSGGIDATTDWLEFGGKKWRFLKIVPRTYWATTPSVARLHLREVGADGGR